MIVAHAAMQRASQLRKSMPTPDTTTTEDFPMARGLVPKGGGSGKKSEARSVSFKETKKSEYSSGRFTCDTVGVEDRNGDGRRDEEGG